MNDESLKRAVLHLYLWQMENNTSTSFTSALYTLMMKADVNNRVILNEAFPNEAEAMHLWNNAGDYGNDLFRAHGLME